MTTGALLFMLGSFAFVLGLAGWSFWRILRGGPEAGLHDPDGTVDS